MDETERRARRLRESGYHLVVGLGLALVALPGQAWAQPTVAHASEAQKERARTSYAAAKDAYQAGRYDEALSGFEASYEAVASPNSRLMVARSLRGLGRNAEAYHAYEDTVQEAEQWGDDRYHDAAESARQEMAELKPSIAMVRIAVTDPRSEAKLTLNGREIDRRRWKGPLAADPGPLTVVLEAPDGRRAEHSVTLEAGVAAALELKLSLPPAEPEPTVEAPEAATRKVVISSGTNEGMRTAAYVAGGVGVVGLGAFAALGIMSNGKFDDLQQGCPMRVGCDPALQDTADSGKSLQTGANIGLLVGAVGVTAGIVLFVLSVEEERTEVTVGAGHIGVRGAL